jgi:geranylgeranyl pyrophosphate synthase
VNSLKPYLEQKREQINQSLADFLPSLQQEPYILHNAMRYSVLNGGKRMRPLLVYIVGEALGATPQQLDRPACAIELIHAYSLVHDDLPAMDNDDLRRGKPTCHKAFDEATAILVGDALQTLAFQLVSDDQGGNLSVANQLQMVHVLAIASGSRGMAGGQALDLLATGQALRVADLENLHQLKTGALIRASVELGILAAGKQESWQAVSLRNFAQDLGLAFQVQDDILDVEGCANFGKQIGHDKEQNKFTYPAIVGLETAKAKVATLYQSTMESLSQWGDDANILRQFTAEILRVVHHPMNAESSQ